jgi:hypothetical protein
MPSTNASSGFDTVKLLNPTAIAVMDTGVDCFHRDLNVVFNVSFNERPPGNDPFSDLKGCWDVYDHGTNVAGACTHVGVRCPASVSVSERNDTGRGWAPVHALPSSFMCACASCACVRSTPPPSGVIGAKNNGYGVIGVMPGEPAGGWCACLLAAASTRTAA